MADAGRFDHLAPPTGARIVVDPEELATFYADRPDVHLYAIADLDEPFWSGSRWFRRGDAVVGVVGMPGDEGSAAYAMSTVDPAGTLRLLTDLAPRLPVGLLVVGALGAAEALRPVRSLVWDGLHVRYGLTDRSAAPVRDERIVELASDDLVELQALYDSDPGAAFFLRHMLADESYVGIRIEGELVAAAGTHVLSESRGVAAIGAVYTRPGHRGRGLGRAVTAGAIERIADRIEVIGLNVAADNAPARRIYESIGFAEIIEYEEAELAPQG